MSSPVKVKELDHVVLRCRDQARALDFYTRVLGLEEERRVDGLVQLRAGASMIDLVPADDRPTPAGRNMEHFCVGVDAADMDELARALRDLEVEVIDETAMTRYGARGMGLSIYIRDTEGNVVELKQMPRSAQ
jgi:glyoxylase I family protein